MYVFSIYVISSNLYSISNFSQCFDMCKPKFAFKVESWPTELELQLQLKLPKY